MVDARQDNRADAGSPVRAGAPAGLAAGAVRALDRWLRHRAGVFEFCDDPLCVFRISLATAQATLRLGDGTVVRAGDPVVDLHFWNEHMPTFPRSGPSLRWGMGLERRFRVTFAAMVAYLDAHPDYVDVRAIRGETAFAAAAGADKVGRLLGRWGFEAVERGADAGLMIRVHDRLADLLPWALAWLFNPAALNGWQLRRRRVWYWLPRRELNRRYGPAGVGPGASR